MAKSNDTVDFIVVGGGTSGLVVANRLTKDPNVTVTVLEAGPSCLDDPRVNIPAFWTSLIATDLNWKFASTPQVCVSWFSTLT